MCPDVVIEDDAGPEGGPEGGRYSDRDGPVGGARESPPWCPAPDNWAFDHVDGVVFERKVSRSRGGGERSR